MLSFLCFINCLPQAVRATQDLGLHVRRSDPPATSEFLCVRKVFFRTPVCTETRQESWWGGPHSRSRSPPAVCPYPVHAPAYALDDESRYPSVENVARAPSDPPCLWMTCVGSVSTGGTHPPRLWKPSHRYHRYRTQGPIFGWQPRALPPQRVLMCMRQQVPIFCVLHYHLRWPFREHGTKTRHRRALVHHRPLGP
jgi:hypothetical protein